ncbi:MAG: tetratricopeptide repeat protein, partial [Pirellulales bacterium]
AQTLRAQGDQTALDALRATIELGSSEPEGWDGWQLRGSFFAAMSDWEQADTAFTKAAQRESDPNQSRYLYYLALVRMARNDLAGYREACGALVKRAGQSTKSNSAYMTAWACVLGPNSLGDPDLLITLVERAGEGNSKEPRYLATLGAALYRAGRFDEAGKRFAEAIEATPSGSSDERVVTYGQLFLAMIHRRLGQPEEARQRLTEAVQVIDKPALPGQPNYAESWDSILPLQLLRQEAERMLADEKGDGTTTTLAAPVEPEPP